MTLCLNIIRDLQSSIIVIPIRVLDSSAVRESSTEIDCAVRESHPFVVLIESTMTIQIEHRVSAAAIC